MAFIKTDFQFQTSVCRLSMAQLVASLISVHVAALSNPYCLSYESAILTPFMIDHLDTVPDCYVRTVIYSMD